MKIIGIILIVVGLIWAGIAFNSDVTVATGSNSLSRSYNLPDRVNNIGLMAERQNHLILSGITIIIGILLFGFGSLSENSNNNAQGKIACPFCSEKIISGAKFCRFCQKELPDSEIIKEELIAKEEPFIETVNNKKKPLVYKHCNNCHVLNVEEASVCSSCESPLEA